MSDHIMLTLGKPEDETLTALGLLVVYHGHLEYILKMTLKSLLGISISEALEILKRKPSSHVRCEIEKESKKKLRGDVLEELSNFVNQAREASEKRNEFVHSPWATKNLRNSVLLLEDKSLRDAPSGEEIKELAFEVNRIYTALNLSRLEGNIFNALKASGEA